MNTIKTYKITDSSRIELIDKEIEIDLITLVCSLMIIIDNLKLYLEEIIITPGKINLKSGEDTIVLKEIL